MGTCCCCCEEEPPLRVPNHADFRQHHQRRDGNYGNFFTASQQRSSGEERGGGGGGVFSATQPTSNALTRGTCQFCGNLFDPSLLDGHQETCRANLRKKASEMRTVEGQVVNLRVFELEGSGEYSDDQVCVVCMSALRSYAIIPCGHLIACGLCAKQLETCPMCRKDRQGLLFVDPTVELKTTCKSCKNVIHPAYFDGHREVCALHMRQLAAEIARQAEEEKQRVEDSSFGTAGGGGGVGGRKSVSAPPSPALEPTRESDDGESVPLLNKPQVVDNHTTISATDEYSEREGTGEPNHRPTATTRRGDKEGDAPHQDEDSGVEKGGASTVSPLVKPSEQNLHKSRDTIIQATAKDSARTVSPSRHSPSLPSPSSPQPLLLQNTCIECRKAPIEVAFIPCGHSSMCGVCAERVTVCPNCLTPIQSTMHTFK